MMMQYRFDAIDNENTRYDFWAHSFELAEKRLKDAYPELDFIVFYSGGCPKNLTFNLIKKVMDRFPMNWKMWMSIFDEVMEELMQDEQA